MGQIAAEGRSGVTVEHILPQKGSIADYPLPTLPADSDDTTAEARRKRLVNTVGNLTLLTGRFWK